MRAPVFLVGLVVGGLAGALATSLLTRSVTTARRETVSEPVPAAVESAVSDDPDLAVAEPVPAAADALPSEDEDLLARAIAMVEPPEIGERSGRIHGRVAQADGTPLPGVQIIASPGSRPDREKAETLEARVRSTIRDELWREGLESKAATAADGSYSVERLADLEYRLSAKLEGFKFEGRTRNCKPGDEIDFIATALARIEVAIVREDGSVPERASVSVRSGNSSRSIDWSPSSPVMDVDPGRVTVSASVGETERSEPVEAVVAAGTEPVPVRIVLQSRGAIRGVVRFPKEELDSRASVHLLSAAQFPAPTAADFFASDREDRSLTPGETFTFGDLDPGAYWIGASRGEENEEFPPAPQLVEVGTALVEVELALEPIRPDQGVLVLAYAPDGTPLTDVDIRLGYYSSRMSSSGGGSTLRMRGGGHMVLGGANLAGNAQQSPGGKFQIDVRHNSYGSRQIELDSLAGGQVEVRFEEPARVVVTVAGYAGSEHVGRVSVDLFTLEDPQRRRGGRGSGGRIDANGELVIEAMSPGEYLLAMDYGSRDRMSNRRRIHEQTVTVVPGENRWTVSVPALYTIEVRFPLATAAGNLQAHPIDAGTMSGRGGQVNFSDGVARIEGLLAGRYQLRAWGTDAPEGSQVVDVPAAGPILFDPAPANALRVRIHDPAGPMNQSGLQDGDWIVAIDGQAIAAENLPTLYAFLRGAETVKLIVVRGEAELELDVDPKKILSGDPGGWLEPMAR